jgi:hypothetical protein
VERGWSGSQTSRHNVTENSTTVLSSVVGLFNLSLVKEFSSVKKKPVLDAADENVYKS